MKMNNYRYGEKNKKKKTDATRCRTNRVKLRSNITLGQEEVMETEESKIQLKTSNKELVVEAKDLRRDYGKTRVYVQLLTGTIETTHWCASTSQQVPLLQKREDKKREHKSNVLNGKQKYW